jgi:uncharacterized protein YggE
MQNSYINHTAEQNIMTLAGTGQVTAVPDLAILRLGVQTSGENLVDIQNENASISQVVLQSLQQIGINDIKTYDYEINKMYEYEDSKRIDKGYSVRNILEIKTNNLDQIGSAIDTAVYYGANIVDLIEFDVSDKDGYYLQALDLAIANAISKANTIAGSLGLMNPPVPTRITEVGTMPSPTRLLGSREGVTATPIEPGSKQIEANVIIEFTY